MVYFKWAFWGTFWLIVAAFFHYTLPQNDIVRIVNTEVERQELNDWTRMFWATPDDQSVDLINRDVQFIHAVTPEGDIRVYRNEDTGWGWPPYFKFDTSNLYAEASDAVSTKAAPEWYAVKHYGWRNEFLSIFPNAVSIKPVAGPDVRIIPWLNIVILTLFFALVWAIWARWRRFRRNRIDPVLEELEDSYDAASDSLAEKRGRIGRWLDSWKSKK
ncbi:DUF1523 family protein [Thalassovita mangrovi]|uniref:DUF1523 family protein n=1 Tax=Thalassovita mangrovi TaxID=2692236 RepID=A0A6L8LPJ0_9RHOB|nr:DUF1523 family protein [Thalassovita mangrovi]MYM55069.1 DUF1523 family protein [Thalassovita mangrovi]